MNTYQRPQGKNLQSPVSFTYNGTLFEGFRPYEGETDVVNISKLSRPHYALITALCSVNKTDHSIWTVVDTKHFTTSFDLFITNYFPSITFIRYLRSRT